MAHRDIVAIGASAGGLSALKRLAAGLPAGLDAAVLVVQHVSSDAKGNLPGLLERAGPLPAAFAEDGAPAVRGRIHVAPPNRHLLLQGDTLRLSHGAWENGVRPAVDTLFRSVAVCCGSRSIGVVLTGYLDDGSAGLRALRRCGGVAVVQDPADAEYPDMPRNALATTEADHMAALDAMPSLLARLVASAAGRPVPVPPEIQLEADIMARRHGDEMAALDRLGQRSVFTCPDCGGVMWELHDGDALRYRCHLGHAYSAASLGHAMSGAVVEGMETALRTLEERGRMLRRLGEQADQQGQAQSARLWSERAQVFGQQADAIRAALLRIHQVEETG
ncbi:MAG: chemotaxis protein CheB [Inquilinus limosus]|uniref:protein-glutamate methylesterase n=1 Tax=Inquilinus limosus TaxID=171674 RepID=A0A952FS89_9PROT|nr:chemotaxis protein CheB [Inquilinus limosus]